MNKVKFRAWDKAKGHFVDFDNVGGYLLLAHDGKPTYFARTGDTIHPPYVGELADLIEINLYTGLKDKTGKPIFEGDIVRFSGDENFVDPITWNDEYGEWWANGLSLWEVLQAADSEVIGNIYENPELVRP